MAPMTVGAPLAGPTVGWMSAIAAYGSYLIPIVFKGQVEAGTPQAALYGFACFYLMCLAVNGYRYLGWGRGH